MYFPVLWLIYALQVRGHSWVEQLSIVEEGQLDGSPGYPRGFVPRTSPSFSDDIMTNLVPPDGRPDRDITPTDRICKLTQDTHNQTSGSPILSARAGDTVVLRYQENGHITLPQNNPPGKVNAGLVYVYGTTSSLATDMLAGIHMVWDPLGTGGDGRGRLLTARSFDDGGCYQVTEGPISKDRQARFPHAPDPIQGQNLWCEIEIILPDNLASGELFTLY